MLDYRFRWRADLPTLRAALLFIVIDWSQGRRDEAFEVNRRYIKGDESRNDEDLEIARRISQIQLRS